jgi:hypothetical protein
VIELPVIGCGLDEAGLAAQLDRYRTLAAHVASADRRAAEIDVRFAPTVDAGLLAHTIELERACCSFFAIDLDGDRLRVAVADRAHQPALAALADALGVAAPR